MRLQVDIDPEVKAALRMRSARDGVSLSRVTEDALIAFLGVSEDEPEPTPPKTTAKPKAK